MTTSYYPTPEHPHHTPTPCESGTVSGVHCGEPSTTTIEWMPVDLRASHEAAGNHGTYPANGARRLPMCAECAEWTLEATEWASEVGE